MTSYEFKYQTGTIVKDYAGFEWTITDRKVFEGAWETYTLTAEGFTKPWIMGPAALEALTDIKQLVNAGL
jgi:hypothetical protein